MNFFHENLSTQKCSTKKLPQKDSYTIAQETFLARAAPHAHAQLIQRPPPPVFPLFLELFYKGYRCELGFEIYPPIPLPATVPLKKLPPLLTNALWREALAPWSEPFRITSIAFDVPPTTQKNSFCLFFLKSQTPVHVFLPKNFPLKAALQSCHPYLTPQKPFWPPRLKIGLPLVAGTVQLSRKILKTLQKGDILFLQPSTKTSPSLGAAK